MANKKRTKKETSNKAINTEEILEQMKEVSFNTIDEIENKSEEVTNTKENNFDNSNVNEETAIGKNETEETVNDKKNVIEETECKEEKTDVNENTEINESTNESVVDEQMEKLFEDMDKIKDGEKVETTSKKEQKKIRKTTRDVFGYNWMGQCYDF